MKRLFLMVVPALVCWAVFTSCDKDERIDTLKIGKLIEIELGRTIEISEFGLSLRVESITDSRCPIGVNCSWEGNASVEFQLATKKRIYNFTLDTHSPPNFKNDTVIEGVKYHLKNVLPYPVYGEEPSIKTVKILVDTGCSNYCINTTQSSSTTTSLSKSEINTIKNLFNYNNLAHTAYQFTSFQKDELGYSHVRCCQFINNLKIFTSDLIFHFDQNNVYYYLSGNIAEKIDLNKKPLMSQNEVTEKFLFSIEQDEFYNKNIEDILKSCFELELGYYNLNAGKSYANENYTKAWRIKLTNSNFPYAYINDDNSDLIYYDNGIRF